MIDVVNEREGVFIGNGDGEMHHTSEGKFLVENCGHFLQVLLCCDDGEVFDECVLYDTLEDFKAGIPSKP